MTIEVVNNETVIRIPSSIKFAHLQQFIDYITVKSLVSKSEATEAEIFDLTEEIQTNWWRENKHRFIK